MNGFNFNLQKVLDVRSIQEDKAQNEFLQARQKKKEIEDKLQQMNQTKNQVYSYLRRDAESSVEKTIQARQFLQRHKQKIDRQQELLQSQHQEVEERQDELVEKQKKRKVLEKLKDKEFEDYQADFLQTQQRMLDEMGQRIQQKVRE